ncbi:MAG: quinol dehydrogenase ferredoxin subunit NapH [Nitrospirae bacterium]|nr:quinol dehydrogenase ferredoxin subunit NapH [Nitrospirota bacterium]
MKDLVVRNRYLILRRFSQISILAFFIGANRYGWKVLKGNLSNSRLFDTVPLTDPFALLQLTATGNIASREALIGGALIFVFFAVVGGRAFCSWVCPLNMITDLANRLRRVLPAKAGISLRMDRNVRYWAAGLAFVLSAVLGIAAFEWISPISILHRGLIFGMGAGWTAIVAVFLFDLLLVPHGFCGHVCPLGAFYSLAGKFSFIRVRHLKDNCTQCMQCIEHCPEQQVLPMVGIASSFVTSGECTNCAKCIDVCRDHAMKLGFRTGKL